ncbi:MAG: SDR family oxidoreductase [candidate division WS1 bacterium]|jgi:NAD(P)-dependent dehydrogenase (short-subunit alcohol dehydrogenase family)|nr:SDR family oxidoreductase [candidate division WS1 bacterium]
MDLGITDKVAVVTGGARGIGLAIVQRLMEEGCRTVAVDIDPSAASNLPDGAIFMACDVSDEQQCEQLVRDVDQQVGSLDILVNNAGIQSTLTLAEATVEDWERVLKVNLTSAFILSKLVVYDMKRRGWGRIINIGSMAGKVGGLTVSASYAGSKAGMMGLTKSVARTAAPQVTCNIICPAFISTAMTSSVTKAEYSRQIPVGRLGTCEEVAAAVAYLASTWTGYMTGEVLDLNGGMLMD